MRTPYHVVDLPDSASEASATAWWEALTEAGGEGAVVKPMQFAARNSRGLLRPAVKCRGRVYLRIIYGPEYTLPEHLERLREWGLSGKRSLVFTSVSCQLRSRARSDDARERKRSAPRARSRGVDARPLTRVREESC